ncbi:MAG: CapA family protein [Planctomycetaceae bacterium]|jgi:poly-gamma-glutamate synthesis protein (capsule biosynthesis protein)|nr:CapA family protein [Planctomycetaceae bacterium]
MKILIASDICPINRNESVLRQNMIAQQTKDFFCGYDLFLANLEAPLTEFDLPGKKYGESLRAHPETLVGLKSLGINLLSLANNHIMDQNTEGLQSTINALNNYNMNWFGAGNNLHEASRPFSFERENNAVSVLAFSEPFFAAASQNRAGVNDLDVPHIVRSFIAIPNNHFKIVLLHGGNEHCHIPNPALRDTARMLAELGADIVVVQHSHCVAGYEEWSGGVIFHGQGNFIFDFPFDNKSWFTGFLIELDVSNNGLAGYRIIPFEQSPGETIITIAQNESRQAILDEIAKYSNILKNDDEYEVEWDKYCESLRRDYQSILLGHGDLMFKINNRTGISDRLMSQKIRMLQSRTLRSLSHLEVLKNLYSIEKTVR